MSLESRIRALMKKTKSGSGRFGPALYNSGISDAAKIAKEADALINEMAEALECYADEQQISGPAKAALKSYKQWMEKQ